MTLLEQIYTQLNTTQLVANGQTFSVDYLAKNKNWYSYQTHMKRDISFSAAVQCAKTLRKLRTGKQELTDRQNCAVAVALEEIDRHLADRYSVAGMVDASEH